MIRFTIDVAKNLGAARAEIRRHRDAVVKVVATGSKPCPHCGRTISANKPMCFAGITEFGSLQQWAKAKAQAAGLMAAQDLHRTPPKALMAVG